MSGKRLLKRLVTVFVGMLGLFLFLHAVDADAEAAMSHELGAVSQSWQSSSFNLPH